MLPMYDKFLGKISSDFMDVGGVKTACYFYQGGSDKTILLIHGIGGDFHGLIPLAYCLKNDANLVFVDLPSHGRSQLIKNMKMSDVENWAMNLMSAFDGKGVSIDEVVAHSLGCLAANKMRCRKIWYISPPIKTSAISRISSSFFYRTRQVNQYIYLSYYFSVFRGLCLVSNRRKSTVDLIRWLTKNTRVTRRQYLEQSKIARDISRSGKIIISEREFTGLIVGRRDKISLPVNAADGVKIDKFVALDTGHLSVLDSPELVAELILAE